jgi:hypothetical protein
MIKLINKYIYNTYHYKIEIKTKKNDEKINKKEKRKIEKSQLNEEFHYKHKKEQTRQSLLFYFLNENLSTFIMQSQFLSLNKKHLKIQFIANFIIYAFFTRCLTKLM